MSAEVELVFHACATKGCGAIFAVPKPWDDRRKADHSNFYCPHGHTLSYSALTESELLRRELDEEREEHDRCKAEIRKLKRSLQKPKRARR